MMIQGGKNAGKKLFVILILGMTLLQSGCNNKATKETQQKAEKTDGAEKQKKTESGDWEEARTTPYGKYPETVMFLTEDYLLAAKMCGSMILKH